MSVWTDNRAERGNCSAKKQHIFSSIQPNPAKFDGNNRERPFDFHAWSIGLIRAGAHSIESEKVPFKLFLKRVGEQWDCLRKCGQILCQKTTLGYFALTKIRTWALWMRIYLFTMAPPAFDGSDEKKRSDALYVLNSLGVLVTLTSCSHR